MSTGFATLASRGSTLARAPRASPRASSRQLEPGGLAGVGAEDPEPAGVRQHARRAGRAAAAGCESSAGGVDELLERAGAQHAGLAEERVDGGRRSRRARRCASSRRARRRRVAPAFSARIGLRARDAAGERARTCAGCRTTRGRAGRGRCPGRPPTTRAGRSRRRRPCSRSRRRPRSRGRARPPARAARARARRSATRSRCCPGGSARGAKVAFRRGAGDGDAEAVRADQPRAVRAHEREQLLLALAALGAGLGEAGRDHAERADARARAPPRPRRAPASPGTQITARSTASGISAIERVARARRRRARRRG